MINFKQEIAKSISKIIHINENELENYIEIPPDTNMGDYAFPCFKLAKELKKAPNVIAAEIKEEIKIEDLFIEKIETAGGYLNFYTNKQTLAKEILKEIAERKEQYGSSDLGKDKTVLIEYSSPNIAKPMHMGHLRNNILGQALHKIFKFMGYHVIGANFLGDWGINFAKMMAGYFLWKDEYDFSENALDTIIKIYVRFNEEEKEHPEYMEMARQWHLKLEAGEEEATKLWNWLKNVSMQEAEKIYDLLDCKFDDYNGEAYYSYKMDKIVEELKQKNLLVESQGAQIVDLSAYDIPPALILTSSRNIPIYYERFGMFKR